MKELTFFSFFFFITTTLLYAEVNPINAIGRISYGNTISLTPIRKTSSMPDNLATLSNTGQNFQFSGSFFLFKNFGIELSIATIYNTEFHNNKHNFSKLLTKYYYAEIDKITPPKE